MELGTVTLNGNKDHFEFADMEFHFRLIGAFTDGSSKNGDYFFVIKTSFKNSAPRFSEELETQAVMIGQKLEWQLPEIVDDEGDELTEIKIMPSLRWLTLNRKTMKMTADAS